MTTVYNLTELKAAIKPESRIDWPYLYVGHLRIGLVHEEFMVYWGDTQCALYSPKNIVNFVNDVVSD